MCSKNRLTAILNQKSPSPREAVALSLAPPPRHWITIFLLLDLLGKNWELTKECPCRTRRDGCLHTETQKEVFRAVTCLRWQRNPDR